MLSARAIIEMESPKAFLRQLPRKESTLEWVDEVLKAARWQHFGSEGAHSWCWRPQDEVPRRHRYVWCTRLRDRRNILGTGGAGQTWSCARSKMVWNCSHGFMLPLGFKLKESENPKSFLKSLSHNTALEIELQRISREIELDSTPREDSFRPGQRVRRIRLNPFSARPHGGNPNDLGDLGAIVRFLRRKEEPEYSLYLVKWDRDPFSIEYCTHYSAERAD